MVIIEEMEVRKVPETVKEIERRGILRDGFFIKFWLERNISIDNDNLPAPENFPVLEAVAQTEHRIFNDEFLHNGLCHSRMEQCRKSISGILPSVSVNVIPTNIQIFKLLTPQAFINEVFIPQTNNIIVEGGQILSYGEFLVWIGLWFIMETIQGFQNHYFWSNITIYPFDMSPYHFNYILPRKLFK